METIYYEQGVPRDRWIYTEGRKIRIGPHIAQLLERDGARVVCVLANPPANDHRTIALDPR